MEEISKSKELNLVKKSTSYKIVIPANVERLIRFLCERIWDTEWSGVLFYNPIGAFEDGSLEIHCVDILPMDVGSTTYTEFNMSPDVISYMAQNPELLDCKMGLIHSHNNMSTFFSGTDIATLKEEGAERNHFVSLIVNNAGKYTAAITRKVSYKSVREVSYESFDGTVHIPGKEVIEGEELEYFNLDIVFEEEPNTQFNEVADRIKEIKEAKAKAKAKATNFTSASTNTSKSGASAFGDSGYKYGYDKYGFPNYYDWTDRNVAKQPTLFDDVDWEPKSPISTTTNVYSKNYTKQETPHNKIDKELIDSIVNQLITGSVTVTKLDADSKRKLANSVTARFNKRFGDTQEGLKLFSYWATDFIEFLLWYSVEDPTIDECDVMEEIANGVIEALKKLPESEYIEEYIDLLLNYVSRI